MKAIKDLTVSDLLAESRRWVVYPGPSCGSGVLAEIVFEEYPYRLMANLLPGDSAPIPPLLIEDDAPEAWCKRWSVEKGLVRDEVEYLTVVGSSIGAQIRCREVSVSRDAGTGKVRLRDGYGNEMLLDEENALRLYRDLAEVHGLPFARRCEECGEQLTGDEACPWCGDSSEPTSEDALRLRVVEGEHAGPEGGKR